MAKVLSAHDPSRIGALPESSEKGVRSALLEIIEGFIAGLLVTLAIVGPAILTGKL